ncbi:MAG: DUF6878 family protein [Methylocella sp.]
MTDTQPSPVPALDLTSWDQKEREHARLADELLPANKNALFNAFAAAGIETVTVVFDGYGDSGQIENIEAKAGGLAEREGDAADDGVHVLLRIREDAVREQIGQVIETDPTLTRITAEAISGADIHAACLAVVACSDLSEQQGAAEFRASLAAIREAEQRLAPAG